MIIQKLNTVKKAISLLCILAMLVVSLPVFATGEGALLTDLWVSGSAVVEFDPAVHEYTLQVPYTHQANGDWELVFPTVYTAHADGVTVTSTEETNKILVSATDGSTTEEYTLNIAGVGDNLYADGSFEDAANFSSNYATQYGSGASVTQTNEDAAAGSYAMKIDYQGRDYRWTFKHKDGSYGLAADKTYYSVMKAKLASANANDAFNTSKSINVAGDQRTNYTEAGMSTASGSVALSKTAWATSTVVLKPTAAIATFTHSFLTWSHNDPITLIDDCYLGELVVTDILACDEMGTPVNKVMMPSEGVNTVQLYAKALNQYGTPAGLENETAFAWRLVGNPDGVTITEDGLLSIDASAEINSTVYAEVVLTPGFTGAVQTKAKGRVAFTVCDMSASELTSLELDGKSLPGFMPEKKNYTLSIPANRLTGNPAEDIPVVTAIPKVEEADIQTEYPSVVDGGVITITVTSPDGIENVYTVTLKVVGQNLYTNGNFESGTTAGWTIKGGSASIVTENPGEGEKSMLISGANSDRDWTNGVILEKEKTYITSCMVRLNEIGIVEVSNYFNTGDGTKTYYNPSSGMPVSAKMELTQDWQKTVVVLTKIPKDIALKHYFSTFTSANPDIVVDDYYIGELIVADMVYNGASSVAIPGSISAENEINLSANILNQFGNEIGLEEQTVTWSLKEDYPGVSVSGNKLTVNGYAFAGTIKVIASCNPFESGNVTTIEVPITLVSEGDANLRPRADYVTIDGIVEVGQTLYADYDFYQVNQEPSDGTITQWQCGSSAKGTFTDIPGATGMSLYIDTADLANSYIRFAVTPKTATHTGDTSYSNVLLKPTAPVATNVSISGTGAVGQVYTGNYTYFDENNDAEAVSTYRWLISDNATSGFTPVLDEFGAEYTEKTYEIKQADINQYIRFEVTPKSTVSPEGESAFVSPAVLCATTPVVNDVEITKVSSGVYSVSYKYSHPLSVERGEALIAWTVDGNPAGNGSSVTVSTDVSHEISVSVTPVAALPPYEGTPETATLTVTVSDKVVGSFGNGIKGGVGGFAVVPTPKEEQEAQKPEPERYWASDAIDFVTKNGFMTNMENGNFEGGLTISRADFINCVMEVLGESELTYAGEFGDVSATDYFAGNLQKAVDMGIISRDENFYPNRNVSRQEVCKILVLAMGLGDSKGADLSIYKDNTQVAEWAKGYVAQAVAAKVLQGVATDEFAPLGTVTRDQTAVILKRLYEFKNGGEIK